MTVHPAVRCASPSLRRLCRTLLLPLLLLLAQQGALLHELSHYAAPTTQAEGGKKRATGPCELCMAFAQVQSATGPAAVPLPLLAGLGFQRVERAPVAARTTTPLTPRNRGPPSRF